MFDFLQVLSKILEVRTYSGAVIKANLKTRVPFTDHLDRCVASQAMRSAVIHLGFLALARWRTHRRKWRWQSKWATPSQLIAGSVSRPQDVMILTNQHSNLGGYSILVSFQCVGRPKWSEMIRNDPKCTSVRKASSGAAASWLLPTLRSCTGKTS